MTNLVTIYGGSGFVGRYIVQQMARRGWRVRVAVRRPNEALFVKPYGVVGQVEPVLCNIRDDESVRAAMQGADAVVNCVGTFDAGGKNNFDAVHVDGAERVARLAAEQGARVVHISALGADEGSESKYQVTKAQGEAAVLAHASDAMILRPSIIIGNEDQFFNRFAQMTLISPVLPIVGANTKFQPVHVDDVAAAAVKGITGEADGGVYELGGPDVADFRSLMDLMRAVIQRRTLVANIPFWVAGIIANVLGFAQAITLGLFNNSILTSDQVRSLRNDAIVSEDAKGFADLGIEPASMESVMPDYLWRFRPAGQYAAIKNSAKNLKA